MFFGKKKPTITVDETMIWATHTARLARKSSEGEVVPDFEQAVELIPLCLDVLAKQNDNGLRDEDRSPIEMLALTLYLEGQQFLDELNQRLEGDDPNLYLEDKEAALKIIAEATQN